MTLGELISALGGKLVQGTAQWQMDGVSSAEFASPSDVAFAEDAAAAEKALGSLAGAVVLRAGCVPTYPPDKCVVEAEQPRLWFALAAKLLKPPLPAYGVHPTAVVGMHAELADSVTIGPCAVVEEYARIGAGTRIEAGAVVGRGVRIGEFCRIYPRAVIYPGTELGNWVVVHAGAVLGADGFGYVRDAASGAYTQFP
jgi:UDP-3-O-[3-hydroxymyristoyl] glucosamine N-acyltransferase